MPSLGDIAQRARQAVPGVQDVFGGQSAVLDSLYNRYVHPPLQGLANAVQLTGDVARGQATMEDPATQQRAVEAGANVASWGGGAPEGALGSGFQFRFPKGIIAYHGSPHTFERFDPAKIGTGEGSQVYGHGLYFAENERVAKGYRDRLAPMGKTDDEQGVAERILQAVDNNRVAAIREAQTRVDWAREAHAANSPYLAPGGLERQERILALLQDKNWEPRKGSMYQVRLHADPEELLHWDKPLSEQSPAIREFMRSKGITDNWGVPKEGGDAYLQLMHQLDRDSPSFWKTAPQQTAQTLEQAGVPGITYLDAGSRAAGQGTSNYVVFNPQIIDILKRYGLTGPGLAALAYMANQQQQQQPQPQPD